MSQLKLSILELKELATATNHIIHPSLDSLCAEICILVANETTTLGFICHKMVFACIKLLMERGFLIFVYPDKGDWIIFIDIKDGFQLFL